jgi:hypothetical protein
MPRPRVGCRIARSLRVVHVDRAPQRPRGLPYEGQLDRHRDGRVQGSSLALTQLASNDDTTFTHPFSQTDSQIAFNAIRRTAYHIAVDSFTGSLPPDQVETGEIFLSWDSNDNLGAATMLPTSTSATLLAFGDNDGATIQKANPWRQTCACGRPPCGNGTRLPRTLWSSSPRTRRRSSPASPHTWAPPCR